MTTFKLIGRGPSKVLLFPGLLGTRDAFDDMLRYADLDAFQYVVFEYRGYGQARDEAGLFTLHEAVIDAVRVVEFLGWTKLAVVGHSLGALVAQMLAVAFPNRIEAIVSIAGLSAKGASADPERRSFMQQLAHSLEKREALVKSGTAGRYMPGVTRALATSTWLEIDGNALARYAHDASRTDIHEQVGSLDAPILVLVGEHDPNCSAAVARDTTLCWYRHAALQILRGAGHYPLFETPAATLSALEQHVACVRDGTFGILASERAALA
jgi:pimeloyl-ACP methyl ester carboxylesterase